MQLRLQIDAHNLPAMLFWVSWVMMPFTISALIDPAVLSVAEGQSQQAQAWRRLVIMFACSAQLSVGLLIKVLKRNYPLESALTIVLGSKKICIRAGADLKPLMPLQTECAWGYQAHYTDDIDLRLGLWANGISLMQRDNKRCEK